MPLDAQSQALLDARKRACIPPVSRQTLEEIRGSRKEWRVATPVPKMPVDEVFDKAILVEGGSIKLRIYRPSRSAGRPAIVYLHGGGWVLGDLDHSDALCRYMAAKGGHVVVNVDYRLAPEHRYPTATEDCYSAFQWTAANAEMLGIDSGRIVIAGGSAGGNLAAAVCLMARDRGSLSPVAQILAYPVLDDACSSPSYEEFVEGFILGTEDMRWYWRQYLDGMDNPGTYAMPLLAEDLSNLPPALVITAENDPVRDDGERYAVRLKAAGIPAVLSRYAGTLHGFFAMPGASEKGTEAVHEALAFISSLSEDVR